jgi:hypothetical protein
MPNSPGRRAAAYWFVDGFPEIVLGAMLIVCGAAGTVCDLFAPLAERDRELVSFLIVTAGFLVYYLKERSILGWLKARITYPRTGYVQPPKEVEGGCRLRLITLSLRANRPANENLSFFRERIVMTIFWFFFAFLQPSEPRGRLLLPLLMATLALALFVVSRRLAHRYRWRSTLVLALLGVPFLWLRIPPVIEPVVGLSLVGAWVLAQGISTLITYLHGNSVPLATGGMDTDGVGA